MRASADRWKHKRICPCGVTTLASGKSTPRSSRGPYPRFSRAGTPVLAFPTILPVEDEAFVRDVACQALCSAGYRVLAARSAADAVRAFRCQAEGVQLLLTDLVLPDKSGCDLALELVNGSGCLKAIFISAPGRRVAIPLASCPVRGRRFLPRAAADQAR